MGTALHQGMSPCQPEALQNGVTLSLLQPLGLLSGLPTGGVRSWRSREQINAARKERSVFRAQKGQMESPRCGTKE